MLGVQVDLNDCWQRGDFGVSEPGPGDCR